MEHIKHQPWISKQVLATTGCLLAVPSVLVSMTEKENAIGESTAGYVTLTQTSVSVSSSSKTYCARSRPTSATADVECGVKRVSS